MAQKKSAANGTKRVSKAAKQDKTARAQKGVAPGQPAPCAYFEVGYNRLGPVFLGYLARLHAVLGQRSVQDECAVLFAYRAGVRLLELYRAWLDARGLALPSNVHGFKVSRLAACKAAYGANPTFALTALGQELTGYGLRDAVRALLAAAHPDGWSDDFEQQPLHEFVHTNHPTAKLLHEHLQEQSSLYGKYLSKLAGDAKRIVLVDSGWRGTTQLVLEQGFPQYSFTGLYFGAMGRATVLGQAPRAVHGLVFESERYNPAKPETCFTLHRHLIESVLEPDLASVQMIGPRDVARARDEVASPPPSAGWDQAYAGVLAYIRHFAAVDFADQEAKYSTALRDLAESLAYPKREEVDVLAGKCRSHDLGREGEVDPILEPRARDDWDNATRRMADALWPNGQAALEASSPEEARSWQAGITAAASIAAAAPQYFHSHAEGGRGLTGHVAIITRTKNRPLLLRRAAESVARQTYKDYTWVVVNDGGKLEDVLEVIGQSLVNPAQILVCHNPQSLGMEAASNAGIRGSDSDFIVIHDDDDSWHPEFLASTTSFMAERGNTYSAVITHSTYVSEEIAGDRVIEHARRPYQDWVRNVTLIEMCAGNFFAPISFLFRRDVYDRIGGFDERLPVLGDWDFNLRYLIEGDIGVIPQPLAYYHHRDVGAAGNTYANSVIGGLDRHTEYAAVLRNKYTRLAGADPRMASLATAMNSGYLQADLRARIAGVAPQVSQEMGKTHPVALEHYAFKTLDERWVLLHAFAERIVRTERMTISASTLIQETQSKIAQLASGTNPAAPADFDEEGYLAKYPDVADAIKSGRFANGFVHYMRFGRAERRARALRAAN